MTSSVSKEKEIFDNCKILDDRKVCFSNSRGFCKCSNICQSEMANGKIVPISQPYLSTKDYCLCRSEYESGHKAALQPTQLCRSVHIHMKMVYIKDTRERSVASEVFVTVSRGRAQKL